MKSLFEHFDEQTTKLWKISIEFHRLKILLATFLISSDQVQNCHGIEKNGIFLDVQDNTYTNRSTLSVYEKNTYKNPNFVLFNAQGLLILEN